MQKKRGGGILVRDVPLGRKFRVSGEHPSGADRIQVSSSREKLKLKAVIGDKELDPVVGTFSICTVQDSSH